MHVYSLCYLYKVEWNVHLMKSDVISYALHMQEFICFLLFFNDKFQKKNHWQDSHSCKPHMSVVKKYKVVHIIFSFVLRPIILVNLYSILCVWVDILLHLKRELKCFCNHTRDITPQAFIYFCAMFRVQKHPTSYVSNAFQSTFSMCDMYTLYIYFGKFIVPKNDSKSKYCSLLLELPWGHSLSYGMQKEASTSEPVHRKKLFSGYSIFSSELSCSNSFPIYYSLSTIHCKK